MPTTYWARTDNNTANNPALNLTGDPAIEMTFTPSNPDGDILLDYADGGIDPDTQVLIDGVAYNFTFELSSTLPTTRNNGAQQVPDQFEGANLYIITVQDYPTAGETTRLAFMPNETATQAEMDSFGNGAISLQNIDTTMTGIICFASGTALQTPDGPRLVECLRVGDLVDTLDHGAQPILWTAASERSWPGSPENELPILISKGALGSGRPSKDLVVSPQHKILRYLAESAGEVLVPVKAFTRLPGIRQMKGKRHVTYHHILFARHEIVLSNDLPSESFYPGPTAIRMLDPTQRLHLFSLFPGLREDSVTGYGPSARRAISRRHGEKIVLAARSLESGLLPSTSLNSAARPHAEASPPWDLKA